MTGGLQNIYFKGEELPSKRLLLEGCDGLRRSTVLAGRAGCWNTAQSWLCSALPARAESTVWLFELLLKMLPSGNVEGKD